MKYLELTQLNRRALTIMDRFTYIGQVLYRNITDENDDDINKQTTKLTVTGNTLLRKFSHCSLEAKLELFRSHCYFLYCNSLWLWFMVAILNCLKVYHNDVLKRLLVLPKWTSSSLAFTRHRKKRLDVIRRKYVFSMKSIVEQCDNSVNSVRQVLWDRRARPTVCTELWDRT